MKVVSLNAWGGAMFDALADWLPTVDVNVLCLQEVTRTPGLGGWTRFTDTERSLPQRANLFDDVRALLPDHHAIFVASDSGPVFDDTGVVRRQEFGIAIFIAEWIRIVDQQPSFVHGEYVEHETWAASERPRVAHVARLDDRTGNRILTIAHLHGLRDARGKFDTPARLAQAARLAELVTAVREPDDFVAVCGDLNLLPSSQTFAVLAEIGLVDLVGDRDTRTSRYPKPIRNANYLLVSDPNDVGSFEILAEPEVSDHRALVLTWTPTQG